MRILAVILVGKEATVEIGRRRWFWPFHIPETWRRVDPSATYRVGYDSVRAGEWIRTHDGARSALHWALTLDGVVKLNQAQERETETLLSGDNVVPLKSARRA